MGYNSFTLAVAANDQATDLLTVEDNRLVSVMLMPERTGSGNAEFFGQIFIVSTETPNPIPLAYLASGYFGASLPIAWTGSITLQPTYAIQARIFSASTIPVRCTILTEAQ